MKNKDTYYSLYSVLVPGLALFARFLRSIHDDLDRVCTRVPRLATPACASTLAQLQAIWDKTKPFSFQEALELPGDQRPLAFRCLGPANLFKAAGAIKIGSDKVRRKTAKVVQGVIVETGERDETYELFEIKPERLGLDENRRRNPVRAVRCLCPSTQEEHWLLVEPAVGSRMVKGQWTQVPDTPLNAIASTIIVNVANPKALWRQGDLIAVTTGTEAPEWIRPYPLDADTYMQLSQIET